MTEPHDITTVSRRPLVGMDRPRPLAEYQATIIARLGYLPSWPELAKHEGPRVIDRYSYTPPASDNPNVRASHEAIVAKGEATRTSILAALAKPMTCADLETSLGRTHQLLNRHLVILAERGKVVGHKVKGVKVWHRVQEATE